jgi:hypothetical protein
LIQRLFQLRSFMHQQVYKHEAVIQICHVIVKSFLRKDKTFLLGFLQTFCDQENKCLWINFCDSFIQDVIQKDEKCWNDIRQILCDIDKTISIDKLGAEDILSVIDSICVKKLMEDVVFSGDASSPHTPLPHTGFCQK